MTETKRYGIEKNQARVFVKMLKTSPQKLNLVAGLIRGKNVETALNLLTFSKKRVANEVKKAVLSAMANAEKNHGLDVDRLIVSEAYVGKAMKLKRFRARARGRAAKVFKHFANLTIVVEEKAPTVEAKKTAKVKEAK
ncbi:MAG: 50S ribosomal protein L22 [Alphaproteobacteria bacterium]|jgi:large subunit ribosomal protein L22|nr:50S ribosomal protein L22 [Alphaproteobacteria bacterium]